MDERPPKPTQHWSTADEVQFLNNLGTYGTQPRDHQALLRQYLEAMPHRRSWGEVNDVHVRGHALRLLERNRGPKQEWSGRSKAYTGEAG